MIGYSFEPLREPWSMIRRTLLNLIALLAIEKSFFHLCGDFFTLVTRNLCEAQFHPQMIRPNHEKQLTHEKKLSVPVAWEMHSAENRFCSFWLA
ncbi:MAG: hypothetical protein IJ129_05225, partial [Ruminococcus sp.]|nr:hypothetical protein [Ruminococcus sp.]